MEISSKVKLPLASGKQHQYTINRSLVAPSSDVDACPVGNRNTTTPFLGLKPSHCAKSYPALFVHGKMRNAD